MAKIINISEKFSLEQPQIIIGDKTYTVNDSIGTVLKFQELSSGNDMSKMKAAIELALGKEASKDLKFEDLRLSNFKVLTIAIMAAMQDLEYEEAESRFQGEE